MFCQRQKSSQLIIKSCQLNIEVWLAGKNSDVLLEQNSSQLIIESCQVSWTEF
jgi:hypothetical protein